LWLPVETTVVKLLIIIVIALVIPMFFAGVFVLSTYNRLSRLRTLCREARERVAKSPGALETAETRNILDDPVNAPEAAEKDYAALRARFPTSLVAVAFGFRAIEPRPPAE